MLTGNEADSPRGRISLMQWLDEAAEISPGLLTHIDRCLQCGACEAMCPSKVPFGALMDTARARLIPLRQRGWLEKILTRAGTGLRTSPNMLRLTAPLLSGYRLTGLPSLLGKLPGTAGRLNALLGSKRIAAHKRQQPMKSSRRVHLFPGCTGFSLDKQTLLDARSLLNALGYDAVISRKTACCGALDQHSGRLDAAASLATLNREALDDDVPVISIASGCAAHLAGHTSHEVSEITTFIARHDLALLHFEPCDHPVGVYVPCTQRNALHQSQSILDLVNQIPGLELHHINPNGGCCGAAGNYMLTQPEFADSLGDAVVERVIESGVQTLLTTNIGCSIHLQARLRMQGVDIDVIHPVTLLYRQLGHNYRATEQTTLPATDY